METENKNMNSLNLPLFSAAESRLKNVQTSPRTWTGNTIKPGTRTTKQN